MGALKRTKLSWVVVLVVATGCASALRNQERGEVTLARDAFITQPNGEMKLFKAGDSFKVEDRPVWVESPGFVSTLIVPTGAQPDGLNLQFRRLEDWTGASLDRALNRHMDQILVKMNQALTYASAKRWNEGLKLIEELERTYPQVAALKIYRATFLLASGQRELARAPVEDALKIDPENRAAQELYRTVTGQDRLPASTRPSVSGEKS